MLPDVQLLKPEIPVRINRVGVKGVKKLVEVDVGKDRPIILISTFDIFIDLPPDLKGANLSRNLEAIYTTLEKATEKPVKGIEDLCVSLAEEVLKKHEYAEIAEVTMNAELIVRKRTPVTKLRTDEVVNISCEVFMNKEGKRRVFIGVEVVGATACPCAQELMRAKLIEEFGDMVKNIPLPTHNQRGKATIKVEVKDRPVRLEELIEIAKASMSCETYELLKREDEVEVVKRMHENPKFVEDCVRAMAKEIVEKFRDLPDDTLIYLREENEESIHPHNVVAELFSTLGDLKKSLGV
ncbi:GTP cyclohydrolase MptA [Archaeoglobus sp.]